VFFHGPRVIYQGPATNPPPQQHTTPPSTTAQQPPIVITPTNTTPADQHSEPATEPVLHHTTDNPPTALPEELVIPSEYEKHPSDTDTALPTTTPRPQVVDFYRPSTDHIAPASDIPPSRPETEERGDPDADPN
jgi:hypothetical protein